jgi:hypothetical protein
MSARGHEGGMWGGCPHRSPSGGIRGEGVPTDPPLCGEGVPTDRLQEASVGRGSPQIRRHVGRGSPQIASRRRPWGGGPHRSAVRWGRGPHRSPSGGTRGEGVPTDPPLCGEGVPTGRPWEAMLSPARSLNRFRSHLGSTCNEL